MKPLSPQELEEQLRASRLREVPDLTPPAGGWEAISARTGAEAAATTGAAPAAASATASATAAGAGLTTALVAKVIAVIVALGLAGGTAVYLLSETDAEGGRPSDAPAPVEQRVAPQTPVSQQDVRPDEAVTMDPNGPGKVGVVAAPASSTIRVPAAAPDTYDTAKSRSQKGRAVRKISNEGEVKNVPAEKTAAQPATVPQSPAPPAPRPPVGFAADGQSEAAKTQHTLPADPRDRAPVMQPGPEPTAGRVARARATAVLPLRMNSPEGPEFFAADQVSLLEPNAPVRGYPKLRRNGKTKAPAFWQAHASVGYRAGKNLFVSPVYDRNGQSGGLIFEFPDGETVTATRNRSANNLEPDPHRSWAFRVGIDRQTRSGFLWRLSFDTYHFAHRPGTNGNREALGADQILLEEANEEFAIYYEMGMQYTFFRRKRFKPYVGVGVLNYYHNKSTRATTFYDERTGLTGLDNASSSTSGGGLDIDLSATAGFQYQFTERWSVGLNSWISTAQDYSNESPFNLEVRRTLGRRR